VGDKALSVFLGNLLLQNHTVASYAIPNVQVTVVTPGMDHGGATDLASTIADLSRVPLTGDVQRDLSRIASVLPNLRFTVSSPLGNTTFVLPKGATLSDIQSVLASLSSVTDPGALLSTFQSENPAAAVLTLGSHSVFGPETPRQQTALPLQQQSLSQESHGNLPTAEGKFTPTVRSDPLSLAKGSINLESTRIPQAVREILVHFNLAPPGITTQEALPHLNELIRVWNAGAPHSDAIASPVEHLVTRILTSAALLTFSEKSLLPARVGDLPQLQGSQRGPSNEAGIPTPSLFRDGGRTDLRFTPLTRDAIARAVLGALGGTPAGSPAAAQQATIPGRATLTGQASDAPQAAVLPASTNKVPGEKVAETVRLADAARADVGLDRAALREGRLASQPRLTGEEREREILRDDVRPEEGRAPHDQESYAGSAEQESAEAVLEALWPRVLDTLRREGFLDLSSDLLRLRPLVDSRDLGRCYHLIASDLPPGTDVLDMLSFMARWNLIDWSASRSKFNADLSEVARYRSRQGVKKLEALLDWLRDWEIASVLRGLNPAAGQITARA
jgi:hypothetical protein